MWMFTGVITCVPFKVCAGNLRISLNWAVQFNDIRNECFISHLNTRASYHGTLLSEAILAYTLSFSIIFFYKLSTRHHRRLIIPLIVDIIVSGDLEKYIQIQRQIFQLESASNCTANVTKLRLKSKDFKYNL